MPNAVTEMPDAKRHKIQRHRFNMPAADPPDKGFLFLWFGSMDFGIWMLRLNVLHSSFGFFSFFRNKTTAGDKKNECQDQGAYDVVLKRASFIGPHENTSGYLPDGGHGFQWSLSSSGS
jgi:hypothetical protein